jgi:hypothetical protein
MTTRSFTMPRTPEIGTVGADGRVQLNEGFHRYVGGIEVLDKRVADYVDPTSATFEADLIASLIAAGLMRTE